jgi:uncharacterized protein
MIGTTAWAGGLGLLALLLSWLALAEVAVPQLQARVTDLTATLTQAERAALEQRLAAFEAAKGSQIAVLIVPSTRPEGIEQYAIRVVESWRLGRKGVDDGVLLLVAKDDRVVRIEVGYGLEGVIPDAVAKRIIEERIVPRLHTGDFYGGLVAGVEAIIDRVSGEPLPPPARQASSGAGFFEQVLPVAMMFVFVAGGLLRALLGRLLGAGVASAVAFFGAWLLLGSLLAALIIALIAFVITLAGVNLGGGYGGGRWGGGLGGGGFSGGGGGFGGGGASGRW